MNPKPKLIRITTVPISMNIILRGQLGFMNQYFEVIGVTGYDFKHYTEIKERENIRMHEIDMVRNISVLKDLKALWQLYWFFKKEKPDIVHTHTPKAGLLGMIASKIAGVPHRLHTVGGIPQIEFSGWRKKILDITEKVTYRLAHKVYPNSLGLKQIILEMKYCRDSKLKVLANGSSNGVNIDFFKPNFAINNIDEYKSICRKKYNLDENDIVFLYVGRIAKDKGINELIDAFGKLNREQSNTIKLILIGPFEKDHGILDNKTKRMLEENENIKVLGRFDDVRPFYLISDVFVFPTYREGFPNVVLEAQSMGLPCIVTNINGCNEIIKNGYNGLIISVKNSEDLYIAMRKLAFDKEYRLDLSSKSRKNIIDNYRREIVWNALLDEYNTFIGNKG